MVREGTTEMTFWVWEVHGILRGKKMGSMSTFSGNQDNLTNAHPQKIPGRLA